MTRGVRSWTCQKCGGREFCHRSLFGRGAWWHFVAYDGDENELVTDRVFALTCGVAAARSLRLISAARHVVVFDPVRAGLST